MGLAKRGKKPRAGRFVGIPYHVANSDVFSKLDAYEVKLLFDLSRQFNGRNNGNLTATLTLMESWGWASGTLHRTQKSLLEKGFITVTRQGWKQRGKPTLLALTWHEIHEPPKTVEYDEGVKVSPVPLNYWCKDRSGWAHHIERPATEGQPIPIAALG